MITPPAGEARCCSAVLGAGLRFMWGSARELLVDEGGYRVKTQFWRRPAVWASAVAIIGVTAGGVAQAAGPYAYLFGINGNGEVACTTQTRTGAGLAPYIEVQLTSTSPSGNSSLWFFGDKTNCAPYPNANVNAAVTVGTGYHAIYVGDQVGNPLKLAGETFPYETGTLVKGYWKT